MNMTVGKSCACGCCEGTQSITPLPVANRPGLPALSYRVGTHSTLFETMLARLSSADFPALAALKTRDPGDPAIALLDCWATVGDVLTFYQERIANEGYLRTATERRSILELARLIGYRLRPGVAASVYLAYTLDEDRSKTPPLPAAVTIPAGSRAQSVPDPDELPQSFETSDPLDARSEWNSLGSRITRPQNITLANAQRITKVYLAGTGLNLKPNDRILFVFGEEPGEKVMRRVLEAKDQFEAKRTEVALRPVPFLVIAAVELLRTAKTALEVQIQLARSDKSPPLLISFMELIRDAVQNVIETLLLDNYPPIDVAYFSHDRIYGLETDSASVAHLQAIWPAAEIRRLVKAQPLKKKARSATAGTSDNLWQDPHVLEVGDAVLDKLVGLLENASFREELAHFLISVVEQVRPTSTRDSATVFKWLSQADRYTTQLTSAWKVLRGNKTFQSKALAVLAQSARVLGIAELHEALISLTSDLLNVLQTSEPGLIQSVLDATLKWLLALPKGPRIGREPSPATTSIEALLSPLTVPPSTHPANSAQLARNATGALGKNADTNPQLLVSWHPEVRETLYTAWSNAAVSHSRSPLKSVHTLRLVAVPFGYNAPVKMALVDNPNTGLRPKIPFVSEPDGDWTPSEPKGPSQASDEQSERLYLDAAYDAILAPGYVVIQQERFPSMAARVLEALTGPRTAYGISGKTTRLGLSRPWWTPASDSMDKLRSTTVYAQSEEVSLAEIPYTPDVEGDRIELDDLYDGLQSGRWLIVSGERTDIPGTTGVQANELVMVSGVEQVFDSKLPGDKTRTTITLANGLAYRFKRATVTIYGNVVKATNGETRSEVLGNGDGSQELQQFVLKQPPLTFVSAPNPTGVDSTLVVRANDVEWHEADTLADLGPKDRKFITRTDDGGSTSVIFGNGAKGARLPTGIGNIKAGYRNGIGKPGNVKAEQISLLQTRPLNVKAVVNPLRASGGADADTRDQARENAPLAVLALDRLVSTQDYADFARTFSGIGKASAARLTDGHRQLVHVTIAGVDDIPIETSSDLYKNLVQALHDFGDPYLPIQVDVRELIALVFSANVKVLPGYQWETVEPQIRAVLLDRFGFDRRTLGQSVEPSEVIATIQTVPGIAYVDLDFLHGITEKTVAKLLATKASPKTLDDLAKLLADDTTANPKTPVPLVARVTANLARLNLKSKSVSDAILPAQLAFLTPDVSDTLILNPVTK